MKQSMCQVFFRFNLNVLGKSTSLTLMHTQVLVLTNGFACLIFNYV